MFDVERFFVDNKEGWEISLKRVVCRQNLQKNRRPLVIVPGYAMNSHIFGYHPSGLSMEEHFAKSGLEVWSIDMRNQGKARRTWGSKRVGLQDLALKDMPLAFDFVVEHSLTEHDRVDVIGASLGGTLLYIHVSLLPSHRVGSMVALGSPLRWIDIHPLIRAAFSSPRLIGMLPIRNTRAMARAAYPLLLKIPRLMHIYLHPEIVETQHIEEMVPTVDDPNPRLNRQIARWIRNRDLIVEGINVYEAMKRIKNPLLCVLANADGIVLPQTASSGIQASGASVKHCIEVGDGQLRFAHADLFVSNYAHEMVFDPIAAWLHSQP